MPEWKRKFESFPKISWKINWRDWEKISKTCDFCLDKALWIKELYERTSLRAPKVVQSFTIMPRFNEKQSSRIWLFGEKDQDYQQFEVAIIKIHKSRRLGQTLFRYFSGFSQGFKGQIYQSQREKNRQATSQDIQ